MTATALHLHRHATAAAFFSAAAERISAQLQVGLRDRGSASFAVPGGSTPGPIFDLLAQQNLDWSRVAVTLTDERWVPSSDPDSNERLVCARLRIGRARVCRLVPLHNAASTPGAGLAEAETGLKTLDLPFDVVLLGMGGDGHFASLFPSMPGLAAGLDPDAKSWLIASDQPINGQPRISLSLSLLLQSRQIILVVRGADKLAVIERAKSASPSDLPISAILRQTKVPVEIHYSEE
jgi:6-phosphogluconolactonase